MSESTLSSDVEQQIKELIAEILECEPHEIQGDAKFVKDLGMDSMMALEILAGIEKKFRLVIPEDMLPKFVDLDSTVKIVGDIMNK